MEIPRFSLKLPKWNLSRWMKSPRALQVNITRNMNKTKLRLFQSLQSDWMRLGMNFTRFNTLSHGLIASSRGLFRRQQNSRSTIRVFPTLPSASWRWPNVSRRIPMKWNGKLSN